MMLISAGFVTRGQSQARTPLAETTLTLTSHRPVSCCCVDREQRATSHPSFHHGLYILDRDRDVVTLGRLSHPAEAQQPPGRAPSPPDPDCISPACCPGTSNTTHRRDHWSRWLNGTTSRSSVGKCELNLGVDLVQGEMTRAHRPRPSHLSSSCFPSHVL
jgi:hypothetical protein